jgi:hypothetical protein
VKGYTFHGQEINQSIKIFLSTDDDKDGRIDGIVYKVLEFINRDTHPTCMASDTRENALVIMYAMSDDREELTSWRPWTWLPRTIWHSWQLLSFRS